MAISSASLLISSDNTLTTKEEQKVIDFVLYRKVSSNYRCMCSKYFSKDAYKDNLDRLYQKECRNYIIDYTSTTTGIKKRFFDISDRESCRLVCDKADVFLIEEGKEGSVEDDFILLGRCDFKNNPHVLIACRKDMKLSFQEQESSRFLTMANIVIIPKQDSITAEVEIDIENINLGDRGFGERIALDLSFLKSKTN